MAINGEPYSSAIQFGLLVRSAWEEDQNVNRSQTGRQIMGTDFALVS